MKRINNIKKAHPWLKEKEAKDIVSFAYHLARTYQGIPESRLEEEINSQIDFVCNELESENLKDLCERCEVFEIPWDHSLLKE
tara:strand:- start:618 stop:866 length:249 start_codon:yes stop_codon:yes gene_type:complete